MLNSISRPLPSEIPPIIIAIDNNLFDILRIVNPNIKHKTRDFHRSLYSNPSTMKCVLVIRLKLTFQTAFPFGYKLSFLIQRKTAVS